jgi:hypothetical protein
MIVSMDPCQQTYLLAASLQAFRFTRQGPLVRSFSKAARDKFLEKCRAMGLREAYLLGQNRNRRPAFPAKE